MKLKSGPAGRHGKKRWRFWQRIFIFGFASLPIILGTTLWIVTNQVYWSILFAAAPVLLGLLQWFFPLPPIEPPASVDPYQTLRQADTNNSDQPSPISQNVRPYWTVPFPRNLLFVGREDILTNLHDVLRANRTGALTPSIQSIKSYALSGLGGIGKTQIALEYAYRYGYEYEAVLWFKADTRENLQADAQETGESLGLLQEEKEDYPLLGRVSRQLPKGRLRVVGQRSTATIEKVDYTELVKKWLESNARWLVILDNIEDFNILNDIMPKRGNGHILLTTRSAVLGTLAQPFQIKKVTLEEGASILLKRARIAIDEQQKQVMSEDELYARKLSEIMDGLPLSLDQAGAYIEAAKSGVKDYWIQYQARQEKRAELLQARGGDELVLYHPDSITETITLSFEKVRGISPVAADMLQLCAFLQPDAIPEEIITTGIHDILRAESEGQVETLIEIDRLVGVLLRYSLIDRNPATKTLTIHRQVQEVLRDNMDKDMQRSWVERTVRVVNNVFVPLDDPRNTSRRREEKRSLTQLYMPHAQACAVLITEWNITSPEAINLLNRAGAFMYQRRRYAEAMQFYKQLLAITKQTQDPIHPDAAQNLLILANLSYLWKEKDKNADVNAEQMYQEALAINEQVLGPDDPHVGQVLTHYAMLLRRLRRWREAEMHVLRARLLWHKLTEQEKQRWHSRWTGNLDSGDGCVLFIMWGIIYLISFGVPIALGLLFQSWWLFLGSLSIILLAPLVTASDQIRHTHHKEGLIAGRILAFLLGIVAGFAGWRIDNLIISGFHLGGWPALLQFILLGVLTILSFAIGCGGTLLVLLACSEFSKFPKYTLFPTLTYTLSTCGVPILLGVWLNSWWIAGGSFIGLIVLFTFLLFAWEGQMPPWRNLVFLLFGIVWGILGWTGTSLFHVSIFQLNLQLTSIVLALLICILAFFWHNIAYSQLSIMGAEESKYLVLEDLWVSSEVAKLLEGQSTDPINDWGYFYRLRGGVYSQQGRNLEALNDFHQALALYLYPKDANTYLSRGYVYLWLNNIQEASADFILGSEMDPKDMNLAWMVIWTRMTKERPAVAIAERLEAIAMINRENYKADHYRIHGVALAICDKYQEGLLALEQSIKLEPKLEDNLFWKGMICAYLGQNDVAIEAIQKALDLKLPPILLKPLYWLEKDRLEFYNLYAQPLLTKYGID